MVANRDRPCCNFTPYLQAPLLTMEGLIYLKIFLTQIQKRIRDTILFELDKPHYHINLNMIRLSSVALSIQNKIRQYGN